MDVLSFSDADADLKAVMDRVVDDRSPVIVARPQAEAVVVVSLSDWNAMAETLHLLATPANASRLRDAVSELDAAG